MESFRSFDDVAIAFERWGRPSEHPPVVLHHGFVADARVNWVTTGVVDALVAAGHHVVAPDARGHGRSDKPHHPASYGEATMARDLSRLLDVIGAERVDLVGYSMGAIVALIAAGRGARVRRLVVGGVGAAVVELGGVDTRALPNDRLEAALRAEDPATIADPGAADIRAFADAVGADRLALAAQAAAVHRSPIPLERITARTLVLAADRDPLAARPGVLADAVPGATLQVVPGDHLGAVAGPAFLAALVAFLDDHDAGADDLDPDPGGA
jgi:pimeloyl-ACP methyl ester carboxylesterase